MSEMVIELGGVSLTFAQAMTLGRLGTELGEFEWHVNRCGCCVSLHPKGQHDRGYVIDREGEADWIVLNEKGSDDGEH